MAFTHQRRGLLYLLILVAIIALAGGLTVEGVDARGRTKVKTNLTIRERVNIQTDNCEMGGGEISVSYGYESDGSESATTSCSGGLLDGNVCINEETTMECYQAGRVVLPIRGLDGTRPLVPITDVQVGQPTPVVIVPVGVDEEMVPVDASGDADGGGDAENVAQPGDGSVLVDQVADPDSIPTSSGERVPVPVLVPLD